MSATQTTPVVLEPAAQDFADATANLPYLFDLGPDKGRETVDEVQSGEIDRPDVEIEDRTVLGGPTGDVSVRIMRPNGADGELPVILYTHGAGWVFGNAHTHDRLIRELTHGTGAALVFPNYSLSPEARYPPRSKRSTPCWHGSPATAPTTASTHPGSRSPATPSGAT
jgi:acetyl esterase